MTRTLIAFILLLFLSSCGAAASKSVFEQRLLDEIDYEGAITFRNDWRLKAFKNEKGLNILIVTGPVSKEVSYAPIESRAGRLDHRVEEFMWNDAWEGRAEFKNMTPDLFDEVCDWIEDEGDWDDVDSNLRWEDNWIQSLIKSENPYPRYKDIHEVWVIDTTLEIEIIERDHAQLAQYCCILGLPLMAISFWPEHQETSKGTLNVKVYDPLNRRFRIDKSIEVANEKKRVHSYGKDILGHLTLGFCNFPPRATCIWYPLYDTDSTPLISDVLSDMDDGDFEEGVEDLFQSTVAMRPGTEPASLRVTAQKGYVDSSQVVTVPFTVKNRGRGESWNVQILVGVKDRLLSSVIPSSIKLGDIRPGKSVSSEVRFRLPPGVKGSEIILTFQPKDASSQTYKKTRVSIPLN